MFLLYNDYFLFLHLKQWLGGQRLETDEGTQQSRFQLVQLSGGGLLLGEVKEVYGDYRENWSRIVGN